MACNQVGWHLFIPKDPSCAVLWKILLRNAFFLSTVGASRLDH
jgi:hypothetical protein